MAAAGKDIVKKTNINLGAGQQLGADSITLTKRYTHIEGPTGIGKTTWLLNVLAAQSRLVLVVPTRNQLIQLESQYGERPTLAFVRGGHKKALEDPMLVGKTVVCTYDMLYLVKAKLGKEETQQRILVIDEAHKLYQAGGYRGTAINNLLVNFDKNRQWKRLLTVSATFSACLAGLAKLTPDEWVTVSQEGRPDRNFEVRYYPKDKFALWSNELLSLARQTDRRGTIIVRVNNKNKIDHLYHTYMGAGLRCQRVHADVQDEAEMVDLLKKQRISAGIDMLFTTSLIDEAINIQNPEGSIHSIHVIGASTHVEEITQFVGRFRKDNPPVVLHISSEGVRGHDPTQSSSVDVKQFEDELYQELTEDYEECRGFAASLAALVERRKGKDVPALRARVSELNATHRRCLEFSPLILLEAKSAADCKIEVNKGSLLSMAYRAEAEKTYGLFEFLARQLQRAIPGCSVTRRLVTPDAESDADKKLRAEGGERSAEEHKQATRMVERQLTGCLHNRQIADLAEAASLFVDKFGANTLHGRICKDFADVLAVVPDFDQAKRIIWRDDKDRVIKASQGLNDVLVKHLHALIKEQWGPERRLKLDGKAASALVVEAARLACRDVPMLKESFETRRGKRSGIRTKKNSHFEVDARTALKIIRENTCTVSSTEGDADERKRGKVIVSGLYYGGYNYKGFNDPVVVGNLDDEFADYPASPPAAKPDEAA